ncbi:hypothetical protein [uncultured Sphingomonas sp.]|uniref:DUF7697 family protein n=1 Tax=uncultured Sphingomonas sp. TaxID=158754 RepID=UPI0025F2DCDB|nr:hypothetical protein [uncultured Sphingomonas sp.]
MRIAGVGQPFALDHSAVMMMGAALGADAEMLADILPSAEAAIIAHLIPDDPTD